MSYGINPDSLFVMGYFDQAAIEYERNIYHSDNSSEISRMLYKKAQCYKMLNNYEKALGELNQITYWSLNDSISEIYRFETALCNYLNSNFTESELQINQIESIGIKNISRSQLILLKTLIFNETRQWQKGYESACLYLKMTTITSVADSLIQILHTKYLPKNLPKYKSEKKANVLRMMPGLGQAYAGKPGEGAFNYLLNLSFLSFGAYQIYTGYYITGYFVGAIGINKVYFGGHARTAKLLKIHNYKVHRNFCNSIKGILTKKAGF